MFQETFVFAGCSSHFNEYCISITNSMFEDSKWCPWFLSGQPGHVDFSAVWPLCGATCLQVERARAEFHQVKAEAWEFSSIESWEGRPGRVQQKRGFTDFKWDDFGILTVHLRP